MPPIGHPSTCRGFASASIDAGCQCQQWWWFVRVHGTTFFHQRIGEVNYYDIAMNAIIRTTFTSSTTRNIYSRIGTFNVAMHRSRMGHEFTDQLLHPPRTICGVFLSLWWGVPTVVGMVAAVDLLLGATLFALRHAPQLSSSSSSSSYFHLCSCRGDSQFTSTSSCFNNSTTILI